MGEVNEERPGGGAGRGKKVKSTAGNGEERPLHPRDLGIRGTVFHLLGTYGMDGDRVIMYVHYIDAHIKNPREIIPNLEALARADGAKILRIEADVVNPKLYRLLMRYYEMRREGGLDVIEIRLAREEEADRE